MSILDNLEALRRSHRAVETAAYLDLSSGTVLYTSATVRQPQERLDALCATAKALLGEPGDGTAIAVSLRSTEALVVSRSPQSPSEALCVICAPDAAVSEILEGARKAFSGVEGS